MGGQSLVVLSELLSTCIGQGFSSIVAEYGAPLHMRNAGSSGAMARGLYIGLVGSSLSQFPGASV